MTPEQFDRWKDFALRMARHGFSRATEARRAKIAEEVDAFFSWYDSDSDEVAQIVGWDNGPSYIGDAVDQHLQHHRHYSFNARTGQGTELGNRFANQVSCCIRAGLDCASSPSLGVLGFTVGDLRRMYSDGIPGWVVDGYDPPITDATPDDDGVWL